jgi:hypothetical protein
LYFFIVWLALMICWFDGGGVAVGCLVSWVASGDWIGFGCLGRLREGFIGYFALRD